MINLNKSIERRIKNLIFSDILETCIIVVVDYGKVKNSMISDHRFCIELRFEMLLPEGRKHTNFVALTFVKILI